MPDIRPFIDTNILLYLLSEDTDKADRAEEIVRAGGRISVQVLNEFTNVARRKLSMSWEEINETLKLLRLACPTDPLTLETHERGLLVAERYRLSIYDSMVIAAALIGNCEILYSEDMQDGLMIDHQLRILNPFMVF
ncbi:MAG: PIN domain-containing protein [Desulfobacterales bacterium]